MSSLTATIKRHAAQSGRDLGYLGAMLVSSVIAFCVWVTCLSLTVSLLVFVVGAFVWLGSVYVFRWTTWIDRRLAGWIRTDRAVEKHVSNIFWKLDLPAGAEDHRRVLAVLRWTGSQ